MNRKTYKKEIVKTTTVDGRKHYVDKEDNVLFLEEAPEPYNNKTYDEAKKYVEWVNKRKEFYQRALRTIDEPVGLKFASLDCVDFSAVCSKETIIKYGYSEQPKNKLILEIAQHEYLTKIRILQKEIDGKFGPMMETEDSKVEPDAELIKQAKEVEHETFFDLYRH